MSKGQLYVMLSILAIISLLFIVKIEMSGNGDLLGGLTISIASLMVLYLAFLKYRLFKWIGIIGFTILSLMTLLAALETVDYSFFGLTLGYSYLAWRLIQTKPSHRSITTKASVEEKNLPPNTFIAGGNPYEYPLLLRRFQSLLIDGMLLLIVMIFVMVLTEDSTYEVGVRVSVFIIITLLYEPLLIVYSSTVGQKIMGIRVRDVRDPSKRINLPQSYFRFIIKDLLGWLSFITIHFNKEHRAIHDFAGSSVMVMVK